MSPSFELIEDLSIPSSVHPGESVHVCIRNDRTVRPGRQLNGSYLVHLHVGQSNRHAKHYAGMSQRDVTEVALRYVLEHVGGVALHKW